MMMTKPEPTAETKTTSAVEVPKQETLKPKPPVGAVEDLERRLALLGGPTNTPAAPGAMLTENKKDIASKPNPSPAFTAPPAAQQASSTASNAAVKGGKNALLVRLKRLRFSPV